MAAVAAMTARIAHRSAAEIPRGGTTGRRARISARKPPRPPRAPPVAADSDGGFGAGVAAGFVSGKVVKSFAYSLVPVAAIGYVVMHAPEILAKLGFEKYSVMIEEQHAKFVEAEEKFEAPMKEKGKEFISGDNLKTMGKLKRKLAELRKEKEKRREASADRGSKQRCEAESRRKPVRHALG